MSNFLGNTISSLTGMDLSQRFGKEWDNRSTLGTFWSLGWSILRGLAHRWRFKKIRGLFLVGKGVTLRQAHYIEAGKNFILQDHCEVNGLSQRGLIFGDKVSIGSYAIIRPTNLYGGEPGIGLKMGNNSNIGAYSYIGCSGYIEIGDNVMISPRVSIYSENHNFDQLDKVMIDQGVTRSFVKIEDDCWIAANSVILSGVTIGKGSVVAAGSIVTKDVPPYSIVAGNPAKVIKSRSLDG
ncbi:acyltransferase [Shivajiella indica]|uniref:Acyltransferase n=1 Tax=Shivajiella indica TaxID=872115 RepID=A0ABW5BE78_9BACT